MALLSLCLAASGLADSMPDLASVSVGSQANGSPPAMMIDLIAQGTPKPLAATSSPHFPDP